MPTSPMATRMPAWLDAHKIDQALRFHDRFSATVDAMIAENRRLERLAEAPAH